MQLESAQMSAQVQLLKIWSCKNGTFGCSLHTTHCSMKHLCTIALETNRLFDLKNCFKCKNLLEIVSVHLTNAKIEIELQCHFLQQQTGAAKMQDEHANCDAHFVAHNKSGWKTS